ncbi:MAG TPA: MFS transporter [Chitinophagaceae bacterium]|nr:MFS transporter [Chitinophagaceae bacterium]
MKFITRTVWILSIVSLFTDMASEMLYPVMPIYLSSIGFSIVLIGVLEGFADAATGLSKGYFGQLSDRTGRRLPFIQWGYALSTISKPLMALFVYPLWVFFARTLDKIGKGIRTGSRDALLSDEATIATKGKVFGFHRALDTFGAVLGPAAALIYLNFYPKDYRTLFFIAFIPGTLAVIASLFLKEKRKPRVEGVRVASFFSYLHYWKKSPVMYRKVVIGLLLFALFNSSDVFLLLKMKEVGWGDSAVIMAFIWYNLIYALCAYPIGVLADKIGLKTTFIIGLILFAGVYFGMAFRISLYAYFALFLVYGIYSASTEGIAKAWISNITSKDDTGTAIGMFSGFQSISLFLASSITGFIWYQFGAATAFILTSGIAMFVALYFILLQGGNTNPQGSELQSVIPPPGDNI